MYEILDETPLTHATNLSNRLECRVLLKREDLQPVFSFKLRGAYNKMAHLDNKQRWKGVIAVSAGTIFFHGFDDSEEARDAYTRSQATTRKE